MKDNKWTYKPLSALCGINLGNTPSRNKSEFWGKGYSWVSISDLKEKYISNTKEEITDLALNESNCKIVKKGTLLMSFKLSIGKLAFAGKDLFTNEAIVALPIKDVTELNNEYLYYTLKFIPLLGGNQAAMGKTLNKQSLAVLQIPLPPTLDDQKRIAKILSQCEELIQKRKESIDFADKLLNSAFLEMFGDPGINPFKLPVKKLSSTFLDKPSLGTTIPAKDTGYISLVRVGELGKREINLSKSKFSNIPEAQLGKYLLKDGDFLLARAIGSESHLGKASIFYDSGDTVVYDSHVMRLRFDQSKVHPEFFYTFLKTPGGRRRFMAQAGKTSIQFNINAKQISEIQIPLPLITEQNRFAEKSHQLEILKTKMYKSLQELENLYSSISQQVFNRLLDLSKVDISDMEDSKKKDIEEVKEELEPIGEEFWDGNYKVQKFEVNIYQIIKKDFATVPFTFDKLVDAISERDVYFPYENIKRNVFELLEGEDALIEQVFDEETKTIAFKLK